MNELTTMFLIQVFFFRNFRLKRIKTNLYFNGNTDLTAFSNFFLYQTRLERVHLNFHNFTMIQKKILLFHILNCSPQLKELEFHSYNHPGNENVLCFTVSEFGEFLSKTRQLESLILNYPQKLELLYSHADQLKLLPPIVYTRLKKLRLGDYVDGVLALEILNRCRASLQYLHLKPANDEIMQKIFQTHVSHSCAFSNSLLEPTLL